jgi:uncharacterized protein (TIGR00730 family)
MKLCVYCGSGEDVPQKYLLEATKLGEQLVKNNIELIYGGGSTGLMGALARSVKANGGTITGVVPRVLDAESVFDDLDHVLLVNSYHERKTLMYHLADAFLVLPGGPGTLEELMEHLTWLHRGRRPKPVHLVNIFDYWRPFLSMLHTMQLEKFVSQEVSSRYLLHDRTEDAIAMYCASYSHDT